MKYIILLLGLLLNLNWLENSLAQNINYDSLMTDSKPKKEPKDEGWNQVGFGITRVNKDGGDLRLAYSIIGNYGAKTFWQGGFQIDQAFMSNDQIITFFGGKGISKVKRLGRIAVAGGPSVVFIHDLQRSRDEWIPAVGLVGTLHGNITPFKSFGMGVDVVMSLNIDHHYIGFRYVIVYEGDK